MAKEQINGEPETFRMRAARRRPDFGRDAWANDLAFQLRLSQRVGDGLRAGCYIGSQRENALSRKRTSGSATMSWASRVVVEVCAGLEVTAYLTAEM
jgi:hypothetical protein